MAARGVAGSLAPGLIARLVGVPQLATVVAELCVTSLTATAQLGTLCTAVSYHRIAEERGRVEIKTGLIRPCRGILCCPGFFMKVTSARGTMGGLNTDALPNSLFHPAALASSADSHRGCRVIETSQLWLADCNICEKLSCSLLPLLTIGECVRQ